MVEQVRASTFHRFMTSGRTSPLLVTCDRLGSNDVDVVIKLNGSMDFGTRSAAWELAASIIAKKMGIYCPTPYVVELTTEFVEVVAKRESAKAEMLRKSFGRNFGSELMNGAMEWAQNMGVTSSMQSDASRVFAFDALTQNPDRTADNPNLFVQGDLLAVIDHEAAFSFLTAILKPSKAWSLGVGDFMERHTLNYALRRGGVAWDVVWDAVKRVDHDCFSEIRECMPQEWNANDDIRQIEEHVEVVLAHRIEFETELRGKIS